MALPISQQQALFRAVQQAEQDAWRDVQARTFPEPHLRALHGEHAEQLISDLHRHAALLAAYDQAVERLAAQHALTEAELRELTLEGVLRGWAAEDA